MIIQIRFSETTGVRYVHFKTFGPSHLLFTGFQRASPEGYS